jgi:DNA-binding CsgD family transcriptional regulator
MNNDLIDMARTYCIGQERAIKRICSPLANRLQIPYFGYTRIDSNGRYSNISNAFDFLEYIYSSGAYQYHPYLRNPFFFKSGCTLTPVTNHPEHQDKLIQKFQFNEELVIFQRSEDKVEGFYFMNNRSNETSSSMWALEQLDLFNKFIVYFKREAKDLIEQCYAAGYNLNDLMGDSFNKVDSSFKMSREDRTTECFLKDISPLSKRERECLEHFQKGYSAQATAASLGISQRTVEHYFDNIKAKLGCRSKWELLNC